MTFLLMLAVAIGIGWLSQTKKQRTGALWAFGTLCAEIVSWAFMAFCIGLAEPAFLDDRANALTMSFTVTAVVGAIMAMIVWSLPNRHSPQAWPKGDGNG